MKALKHLLFVMVTVWSLSAAADAIGDAKDQGLVGEQLNGYLGVVVPSPEINALVEEINAKRKARYQEIANENNIETQTVASLAAKKAIEKTESGHLIKNADGEWIKK